jgi:hypothetical protein
MTALCRHAWGALQGLVDAAVPRYELAFRLGPGQRVARDPALLLPLAGAGLLVLAATLGGPFLAPALATLRAQVSVTLWVLALGLLWSLLLVLVAASFVLQVRALGLWLALVATLVSLAPALLVPAGWLTAAVLVLGLWQSLRMARRPLAPYVFTRTGRQGELRGVRAQALLRRVHLLCMLGLACALTLGNAQRPSPSGWACWPRWAACCWPCAPTCTSAACCGCAARRPRRRWTARWPARPRAPSRARWPPRRSTAGRWWPRPRRCRTAWTSSRGRAPAARTP